ncbi:MAG: class A beta-lactamase-related serine hydrolase [Bryobacterales bacterium]|nr:class A beta-lactamase-related serine hydrolase [Bryobacterales bacterium]
MIARRVLILLAGPCLYAATLPKSNPEEVGVSKERLRRVHALMQRYIDKGDIAGSVTLVARRGRIAHLEAQGVADIETKKPMTTDAIFRLASMTKPIASVAVMMLHEEGHFLLTDPVSRWLPEFKNPKVAIANAPHERAGAGFRLVPAEREITVRDLLTHTAGLASGTAGPTVDLLKKISRKPDDTLADYIPRLAGLPLNFQPGAAWEYGPATDVLGRFVEVVSGRTLDQFFRERILTPLAMNDTYFYLPDEKLPRLTTAYAKGEKGLEKLTAPGPASRTGRFYSGGGGLASTAEDYLRFCQMMLNGGTLEGTRLVSRKTIEQMTANHIGKLPMWNDTLHGYRFGLGLRVRADQGEAALLGSLGSFGWGGAHGTFFWVDPKEQMIGIMMIQLMPYAHINIRHEFQNAATQAIAD